MSWKDSKSESGLPVSQVEPVADDAAKHEIAKTIKETENIFNIDFW